MSPSWATKTAVQKGGELGWVSPGDTVPEFKAAMTKAALNTVVGPVRTQFGYHLLEVTERRSQDVTRERTRQRARSPCVTVKRMKPSRHGCANSAGPRDGRDQTKRHLDVHLGSGTQPARRRVTATKRLPDAVSDNQPATSAARSGSSVTVSRARPHTLTLLQPANRFGTGSGTIRSKVPPAYRLLFDCNFQPREYVNAARKRNRCTS